MASAAGHLLFGGTLQGIELVMESGNAMILDAFMKAHSVLESHTRALVSISGGGDSDVMLDLVERVKGDTGCEVTYVWFDTGIEYRATKEHLDYLEDRYGIEIVRRRAEKSIPASVREFGQPFLSKRVSENMERLQRHGFRWEDEPYDALLDRYPDASSSLKWWTNGWTKIRGRPGWFDIGRNKLLKEFVIDNPPWFPISSKCCKYAKKDVAKSLCLELDIDLQVVGLRQAEGGQRAIKGRCFFASDSGPDKYFPLYWLGNADKADYQKIFGIRMSNCYEVWGFRRTGCVGCPFNKDAMHDLDVAKRYEPRMVGAAEKIFKDAYEYTRMYREYRDTHGGQMVFQI